MPRISPRSVGISIALVMALQMLAINAIGQNSPANEAEKRHQLQRTERELATQRERQRALEQEAAQLARDIDQIRLQTIVAGRSARENEAALSALEETLASLEQEAAAREASLKDRKRAVSLLMAALQKLALQPPEAMLTLPQEPKKTVQSAMAMAGAVPALERRIAALRAEMTDLARTRQKIVQSKGQIEQATGALAQQRQTLDELLKRKQVLEQKTIDDAARSASRIARLANSAKNLKELIDQLETERKAEEARQRALEQQRQSNMPAREAAIVQGGRTLPAAGRILIDWGQPETGGPARGMTIETRPQAIVVAPSRGKVQFAGPFRGYGLILILEHGDGYHSLVAGVNRIDVEIGQMVSAGEPLGVMGQLAERYPLLYFELRNNGQPTNPHPWMARRTN